MTKRNDISGCGIMQSHLSEQYELFYKRDNEDRKDKEYHRGFLRATLIFFAKFQENLENLLTKKTWNDII